MDTLQEGLKVVTQVKDWVTLLAAVAFMFIFWEPIAQRLGWKKPEENKPEEALGAETVAAIRNLMAPLFSEMQLLSQHFNHETTDQWDEVRADLKTLHTKHDAHDRRHDKIEYMLDDIKSNGIRCRKE